MRYNHREVRCRRVRYYRSVRYYCRAAAAPRRVRGYITKNDSAEANRALREPETFQGIRICKGEKTLLCGLRRYLVTNYYIRTSTVGLTDLRIYCDHRGHRDLFSNFQL